VISVSLTNKPRDIVCTFPPEYCTYTPHIEKCKNALQKLHPEMYKKIHDPSFDVSAAQAAQTAKQADETEGGDNKPQNNDTENTERNVEKPAKPISKKKAKGLSPKITIKKEVKAKKKSVTIVNGLEGFGRLFFTSSVKVSLM